jgi:hypothetical protein
VWITLKKHLTSAISISSSFQVESIITSTSFFFPLALQPNWGLGHLHETVSLQLLDLGQSVGLLGWVILSQGVYLYTNTEKCTHNINPINIHALSGIRTHGPGIRASKDSSCLKPLGYYYQLKVFSVQAVEALGVARDWASHICIHSAHSWQGCQPYMLPLFTPRKIPGTDFCQRLCQPLGHSAAGRIGQTEKETPHPGLKPATSQLVA